MSSESPLFETTVADGYRRFLEPVIFRPWADRLVSFVALSPGQTVLDLAAGTGVVSRASAEIVGGGGRVIASDISPAMLAHVEVDFPANGATLETLACSATSLELPDEAVDTVLCQQGLPFIPDRPRAVKEMARVLRRGGWLGISVWLSTKRIEPFIVYGEALQKRSHLPEPFPGGYDSLPLTMTTEEVGEALTAAGLVEVEIRVEQLELEWPDLETAVNGLFGTPYGPIVSKLEPHLRQEVLEEIGEQMSTGEGSVVSHVMTAILAKARRP